MKKAYYFIDDVIWLFRDLTRKRPASLFDNPFIKMLKTAHDRYGLKVQLNAFYRTSYFYGNDEFSLADMTDAYKAEWESASDWLKLSFHAKEEFPDYPHVNATYEDVKAIFESIKREIVRFAGEATFTYGVTPHWGPMSFEGVRALYDCGVRIMWTSVGDRREYTGDMNCLPYGHAMRLLNNRQPETGLYNRSTRDVAIYNSICCYNHITEQQDNELRGTFDYVTDEKLGMGFKEMSEVSALNLIPYDEIEAELAPYMGNDYFCIANHEQYFYEDYISYEPDFEQRIMAGCAWCAEKGLAGTFTQDVLPQIG